MFRGAWCSCLLLCRSTHPLAQALHSEARPNLHPVGPSAKVLLVMLRNRWLGYMAGFRVCRSVCVSGKGIRLFKFNPDQTNALICAHTTVFVFVCGLCVPPQLRGCPFLVRTRLVWTAIHGWEYIVVRSSSLQGDGVCLHQPWQHPSTCLPMPMRGSSLRVIKIAGQVPNVGR